MRNALQIAFGLLILMVGVVALWLMLSAGAGYLFGLDKAIVPAALAALVAVFLALFTFWKERSKARSEAHREKKIEVYSIFFDIVFSVLRKMKEVGGSDAYLESKEFKDQFFDLMKGATFYGSPGVVKALSDWRTDTASESDPLHSIKMVGSVLLAMRKDIGLSNFGIDNLTIHQIYVNDDIRKLGQAKVTA
ncbi:hypothetical protein EN784_51205 [bacterium M00.F.Ca.ET.141.01.1.1]|uniref:hypothetical protein n=1 Tax=Mesorhizobium sp. M8A.F.Ca.ET.021.01.1.1 TaxID=2496757 RepID=UPI000FCAB2DC|nr:hypothetical protein [Mesorhizobium sp. M8A.F.Ca.ET.021.01.1.1]RUW55851.1 hypothetical protein EOA36_06900 [Mesorhizobium sp. M8A.F.Ca.ET.021.01.1.1]TGV51260.1 hypothetical protein EN784_51205 [bacterium M00.F.Ca.ET.141.01.1.1]TIT51697.1 MAG: hypothetical protein E5W75_07135 [Mesorhizobium sp.]